MKLLRTEIRNLNHLEKAKWLKTLLEQEGYDVRSYEILSQKISRINSYRAKRIKKLEENEVALYDLLLKHDIKPRPIEDWLMATQLPEDLKYRYRSGEIKFVNAYKEMTRTKRESKKETESGLRADIIRSVGRF